MDSESDVYICLLAVIEELIEGLDGFTYKIRMKTGKTNRPIAKLYPLEVSTTNGTPATPHTDDMMVMLLMSRPQRMLPQDYQEMLLSRLVNTLRTVPTHYLWPRRMSRIYS